MTPTLWALWAAFAVLAVLDLWVVVRPRPVVERLAKPGAILALVGVVVASGALTSGPGLALVAALLLCLAGDVLLLGEDPVRFLAGLTAFLLGHLAYAVLFLLLGLTHPRWAAGAVVALLLVLPVAVRIVRGAARGGAPAEPGTAPGGAATGAGVTAYMAVIGTMAVLGWGTGHPLLGLGASVFVVSDTVLGFNRFVRPLRHEGLVVMTTYFAAQALLAAGALRALAG